MRSLSLAFSLAFALSSFAEVMVPQTGAARIWIPVAGSTAGANDTFFRSEISITNVRNSDQRVQLYWLPQGSPGAGTPLRTYDIPARRGLSSDDFVDRLLNLSGLGAVEVVAVTNTGAFDPAGVLHVTSRIWTPVPNGGDGTMSQTLPAVVAGQSTSANVKAVFGMRRGAQYRLNVGVMNPASTTQRFKVEVTILGPSGVEVETVEFDVRARAIEQVNIPADSTGVATIVVEDLGGGAGDWLTWASSIDNQSGDAWSQLGFAYPL